MRFRKREEPYQKYTCIITGEEFSMRFKAPNPEDLVSIKGYYQLNPDKDDRPLHIKKQLGVGQEVKDASSVNSALEKN
jgi:hypothetical protein